MQKSTVGFIFMLSTVLALGIATPYTAYAQKNPEIQIIFCLDTSCFERVAGASWDAQLLDSLGNVTKIQDDPITSTNCSSIWTNLLAPKTYYWSVCTNGPSYCCSYYYPFFTITSTQDATYSFHYICGDPYSFCYENDGTIPMAKKPNPNLGLPYSYSLSQNYPNPFNPQTEISYSTAKDGDVKITVFDELGRTIATLVDSYQKAGNYSVVFDGTNLTSGLYFYKINSGGFSVTRKMILLK